MTHARSNTTNVTCPLGQRTGKRVKYPLIRRPHWGQAGIVRRSRGAVVSLIEQDLAKGKAGRRGAFDGSSIRRCDYGIRGGLPRSVGTAQPVGTAACADAHVTAPASGWVESVRAEAISLARLRTTRWPPWREADGGRPVPSNLRGPVPFNATARLIRPATQGEPDRSDSQCHEFIVSVVADLVADCQGVAPLSIRRPGQSRRFDPAYSRPASGPTRALLHACP